MPNKAVSINAWIHSLCENDSPSRGIVCDALSNAGVNLVNFTSSMQSGLGIILIDKADGGVSAFLTEHSGNGKNRILVVSLSKGTQSNGAVWRLLNAGASDVLVWDRPESSAEEIAARIERWDIVDKLVDSPLVRDNLIGRSARWRSVLRQIVEAAYFTDTPVLITGESGTGKELVARLIHTLDQRQDKKNLVVLDCTTIVPELSGSEFFGHERGAFTGAVSARDGAFALAEGGSLFLDEVGELPLTLQAELLRVVQEQTYKRVGSNTWRSTKFRLISATNRDLLEEQSNGRFRSDLYYRIACLRCKVPPLRERSEDILPLVRYFIKQHCREKEPPELDDAVCEYLQKRDYPGNIRDLKQLVYRIMYRHVGPGPITAGDIPEDERPAHDIEHRHLSNESFENAIRRALLSGIGLKEIGRATEDIAVRIAVNDEEGNLQRAAKRLGVTDRALQIRRASKRIDA